MREMHLIQAHRYCREVIQRCWSNQNAAIYPQFLNLLFLNLGISWQRISFLDPVRVSPLSIPFSLLSFCWWLEESGIKETLCSVWMTCYCLCCIALELPFHRIIWNCLFIGLSDSAISENDNTFNFFRFAQLFFLFTHSHKTRQITFKINNPMKSDMFEWNTWASMSQHWQTVLVWEKWVNMSSHTDLLERDTVALPMSTLTCFSRTNWQGTWQCHSRVREGGREI